MNKVMDDIRRLSRTRKGQLATLQDILTSKAKVKDGRKLPPLEKLSEWRGLDDKSRVLDMQVYFDLLIREGVPREVLRDTARELSALRRKRAFRNLFRVLLCSLLIALAWKWTEFRRIPRVYAIGSGILVSLSDGSLSEFSFQDGGSASLVQLGMAGDSIRVCSDRFLPWVLGRSPMGTVSAVDFVRTKDSIERFEAIFADMEGTTYLQPYGSAARRKIFDILHLDPHRSPRKIIAENISDTLYPRPFLYYTSDRCGVGDYLLVTVRCDEGDYNIRYALNPDGSLLNWDPILLTNGNIVKGTLRWRSPVDDCRPEIFFTNGASYFRYVRIDNSYAEPKKK